MESGLTISEVECEIERTDLRLKVTAPAIAARAAQGRVSQMSLVDLDVVPLAVFCPVCRWPHRHNLPHVINENWLGE